LLYETLPIAWHWVTLWRILRTALCSYDIEPLGIELAIRWAADSSKLSAPSNLDQVHTGQSVDGQE